MPRATLALLLCLTLSPAASADPVAAPVSGRTLREAIRIETARAAATEGSVRQAGQGQRRNWFRRHPVGTAALAGLVSCFAVGWAAGDDAVFDDYTGEFNGMLLGGICAGSAASVVALIRSARR